MKAKDRAELEATKKQLKAERCWPIAQIERTAAEALDFYRTKMTEKSIRAYVDLKATRIGMRRMRALRQRLTCTPEVQVVSEDLEMAIVVVAIVDGLMRDAWGPGWEPVARVKPVSLPASSPLVSIPLPEPAIDEPVDIASEGPLIAIPDAARTEPASGVPFAQPAGAQFAFAWYSKRARATGRIRSPMLGCSASIEPTCDDRERGPPGRLRHNYHITT